VAYRKAFVGFVSKVRESLDIRGHAAVAWDISNSLMILNNSASLNKGNHDRDGVWISDQHRFLRCYFSVSFVVLVSIEKIFQTLSIQYLTTFPNNSKFVKNTPLRVTFSTLFSVFGNVAKHGLSCLIYYIK